MKIKLNIVGLFTVAVLATPTVFTSCSEDAMDKVNFNPNNPTSVPAKFILADVITSTAFRNVGGDLNTYLSTYVEHEVGTHNQLWRAEYRNNEPQAASTFNNSWNTIYTTLRDARIVLDKSSEGGSESGNHTTLGIAQVMVAYNLALLTDMYGDVPYSEAFDPYNNKTPKLDKQEDLYKEVFRLLDEAIVNIPKGDLNVLGNSKSHDLLFGAKTSTVEDWQERWEQFAYGLRARLNMRLLFVAKDRDAVLQSVIADVDKSFTSASQEASFSMYDAQNLNPLFDFQWSRDGLAASKSIADKMIARNDPRVKRHFVAAPKVINRVTNWIQVSDVASNKETYDLLAINGKNNQVQNYYLTSTFVYSQTAATQLLSYHELQFLKAEAQVRLGLSAESALRTAVVASFKNSEKSVAAAFTAPIVNSSGKIVETTAAISDAVIATYFEDEVKPLLMVDALKEIANQKYLAFSGASGESTEMYNDIRRWKALGEDLIELKNPNKFPVRLPYGSSETTTNPNVQAAYGNGQYVYTEQVWWAGGTR